MAQIPCEHQEIMGHVYCPKDKLKVSVRNKMQRHAKKFLRLHKVQSPPSPTHYSV